MEIQGGRMRRLVPYAKGSTNDLWPRGRPSIEVAVAIIERQGRYLITQRLPTDSFSGRWEFPGGRPKTGESMEKALIREIQEELGITIEVGPPLALLTHRYPNRTVRLHCFRSRLISGQPKAIQCSQWRWVGRKELKDFEFPPASLPIVKALEDA